MHEDQKGKQFNWTEHTGRVEISEDEQVDRASTSLSSTLSDSEEIIPSNPAEDANHSQLYARKLKHMTNSNESHFTLKLLCWNQNLHCTQALATVSDQLANRDQTPECHVARQILQVSSRLSWYRGTLVSLTDCRWWFDSPLVRE